MATELSEYEVFVETYRKCVKCCVDILENRQKSPKIWLGSKPLVWTCVACDISRRHQKFPRDLMNPIPVGELFGYD